MAALGAREVSHSGLGGHSSLGIYFKEAKVRTLGQFSALGFPSKTSAEIAPDHRKLSDGASRSNTDDRAQTRITIAVCLERGTSLMGSCRDRVQLETMAMPM